MGRGLELHLITAKVAHTRQTYKDDTGLLFKLNPGNVNKSHNESFRSKHKLYATYCQVLVPNFCFKISNEILMRKTLVQ